MPALTSPEMQTEVACAETAAAEKSRETSLGQRILLALRNPQWWLRASLALLFALYVRTVGFAAVYDDNSISPWTNGWRDIPNFFTHDIFGSKAGPESVYYRPMTMLWGFLVGWTTGGAPGWGHLIAVFMLLAVVVLAYVLGLHLFRDAKLAMLTALLFGLHPSKVESTAWIGSSNSDGLAGVLFFATMIAFMKWRERGLRRWQAASVALFTGALFTKETMVCIPVLLAAYLWLRHSGRADRPEFECREFEHPGTARRLWMVGKCLLPYIGVLASYMAVRHQIIKPVASSAEYVHPTFSLTNVWSAPAAIWWFLRHLAMPWGLSVEYTPVLLQHPTLKGFALPALGLAALLVASWLIWRRKRSSSAAFLGIWFVVTLAPPVLLAPMVFQHDRYLFLPAYTFCALVAWAILRLGRLPSKARLAAVLCVVALWSALSWHETGFWDCDTLLWARVLQISPENFWARIMLSSAYGQLKDFPRALATIDEGLRYYPDSPSLWLARAGVLAEAGQPEEAKAAYLKVMKLTEPAPGRAVAAGRPGNARAAAACQLALLENKAGSYREGERYARIAMSLRYDGVGYHSALAESLRGQGQTDEAKNENALELRLRLAQAKQNGLLARP